MANTVEFSFGSDMIRIIVGPEEQRFSIHEALLTARSTFFKNIMTRDCVEAESKTVKLPDEVDPETFALYEQLVYTGMIPGKRFDTEMYAEEPARNREPHEFCAKEYENLCGLYILCERIEDPEGKTAALTALVTKLNDEHVDENRNRIGCFPGKKAINIMYEGTTEYNLGRDVLVDAYAEFAKDVPREMPAAKEVPVEFFRDLAISMISDGSQPKLDRLDIGLYTA